MAPRPLPLVVLLTLLFLLPSLLQVSLARRSPSLPSLSHRVVSYPGLRAGSLQQFNLSRSEGLRTFYVYTFDSYSPATPAPVAWYFHGFGGGFQQGLQLNMTAAADRHGYLLVLPQGTPSTEGPGSIGWNGGRCCLFPPNGSTPVDDVGFTRDMVKLVSSSYTVDPRRLYAMGWSNGGYMSERLGCEAPDLFAGVAADASAVIIGDNNMTGLALCDRQFANRSLNYLHYSGLNDPTVPWTGGGSNREQLPSALLDFARWTRRGGCSAVMEQTVNEIQTPANLQQVTFSNLVWPQCRDGTEMELMTARNGVHSWWTHEQGGFNTTDYTLAFFTRTSRKQRERRERSSSAEE